MWVPVDPRRKVVVSRECEAVILAVLQDAVIGVRSLEGTVNRIASRDAVLFRGRRLHVEERGRGGFPGRAPGCAVA